jgi:NCS1 family nucleobase:cation symporter-1
LAIAHGVGPIFYEQNRVKITGERYNTAWLILSGINTSVGGCAAGITNASDFGRYGKSRRIYALSTFLSAVVVGSLVALIGLVATAAGQKAYGEIFWNPPDLFMMMMDNGHGTAKSRAGIFIVSLLLLLTNMFQNICGNAVAGGIDLSGLFPRYINIRRGAALTFLFAWVVQPWQLINKATTLLSVLSSFGVFLGPLIGIMAADYYLVRHRKLKLHDLYYTHSSYWYNGGVNWRVFPAWFAGWGPTIGGLIMSNDPTMTQNDGLLKVYSISFFVGMYILLLKQNKLFFPRHHLFSNNVRLGFFASFLVFFATNKIWPPPEPGTFDNQDFYGTFTEEEGKRLGVSTLSIEVDTVEDKTASSTVAEILVSQTAVARLRSWFKKS